MENKTLLLIKAWQSNLKSISEIGTDPRSQAEIKEQLTRSEAKNLDPHAWWLTKLISEA